MTDHGRESAHGAGLGRREDRVRALQRELSETREQLELERLKLAQTEAALWQMSVLFGNVPVPVVLMDVDGTITDLNHQAERVFERRREDVLGEPLRSLIPESHRAACDAAMEDCRNGHVVHAVERKLWSAEGERHVERSTMFPIRDPRGEVIGIGLAEDIEELKASGELLKMVNRSLRQLANHDPLTGLPNRRGYERALGQELGRAARDLHALTLIMIDVDDFKGFNDSLGHAAGDDCLARVAHSLRSCLHRPGDLVARYGGEEFVVLLPGADAVGGRLIGERMRASVERLGVLHPTSDVSNVITVSVGTATVRPTPSFDARALQDAADRALYAAKRSGRNVVRSEELAAPVRGTDLMAYRHDRRGRGG